MWMWVLPLYLRAREKKLGKPLKEPNMCFVLFGRHRRLESELYLKYLKHESLEEWPKAVWAGSCHFRVYHCKRVVIFFFSPKTRSGWIMWKKVCLGLSWFLPKRKIKREAPVT